MSILKSTRARISAFSGLIFLALILYAADNNHGPVATTPTARPTDLGAALITRRSFPSLSYGIQVFVWWNSGLRSRDLERVRLMRFVYIKQIIDWNDVKAGPDQQYNWINADLVVGETAYRGIKLIARISKPPYWVIKPRDSDPNAPPFDTGAVQQWCHDLATRYKGKIAGYQVWNEPNLAREWDNRPPNPQAYVKLLAACYQGVKVADPDAVVISAPLAPTGNNDATAMNDERYLQGMFDAGLSNYYDVLGLNAPGFASLPERDPGSMPDGQRWQAFRHVEDMRAIQVARGDGAKQVALLEVGWTTDLRDKIKDSEGKLIDNPYRWHAVSDLVQADNLGRAYDYAAKHWRPWVGLMVTIYLPDPTWTEDDEEYWWSIASPREEKLRVAFFTLAHMARYIDDQTIPEIDAGLNYYAPLPAWTPTTPTPAP